MLYSSNHMATVGVRGLNRTCHALVERCGRPGRRGPWLGPTYTETWLPVTNNILAGGQSTL